jgi:hypothetical protein
MMLRNRVVSHKVVETLVPIVGYTVGITICFGRTNGIVPKRFDCTY